MEVSRARGLGGFSGEFGCGFLSDLVLTGSGLC